MKEDVLKNKFPITRYDESQIKSGQSIFMGQLYDVNDKLIGPVPKKEYTSQEEHDKEMEETANKLKKEEEEKAGSQGGVGALLALTQKKNVIFFHDQFNEAYAAINGNGSEVKKLRSKEFRQWLIKTYYRETGKTTNDTTISMALNIMEAEAHEGQRFELSVRVARRGMVLWYDLGNGSVIKTDHTGWMLENNSPILFRRFSHQLPQVNPEKGGTMNDLLKFINVKDEEDKILIKVYCVAAVIAGFPHPLLIPHGDRGAAKSTGSEVIKKLIDPSGIDTIDAPDKGGVKDFIQVASHHWLIFLDNVSSVSHELSDTLARICTGAGHSKRVLYSDDDDFIRNFQHIVGLNGINQVVWKPDLLNRSILLSMRKIGDEERIEIEEFWRLFNEQKPKILGAIFDAAAKALLYYPEIKLVRKPRMADFARWGCAIAKAIGHTEQEFMDAYYANIDEQNEEVIEGNAMAQVIIKYVEKYMADKNIVAHQPTELFFFLKPIAVELNVDRSSDFPMAATWLWKKIKPVASDLLQKGVRVTKSKGVDRIITIEKINMLNQ